ncbi:DoxX family protein [Roseibacillus persicicus]|uniref:DoxX family protein n=1 Tax=Roseibacillus persicicus TaxID=454148 RepID=UPI00280E3440|nr:DoxX family protein [Roseibacillus persicicus]MDQ8189409.1 DoxX family protein [Roseibacillus persicicus]
MRQITRTTNQKSSAIVRILVSLPLLGIGIQHLIGTAPLEPILRGAGIPFPELNNVIGTGAEILAGALLITGFFARAGAALTIPTMAMALYAHAVYDWADEPPVILPIALILGSLYVIWKGAGAWSLDLRNSKKTAA